MKSLEKLSQASDRRRINTNETLHSKTKSSHSKTVFSHIVSEPSDTTEERAPQRAQQKAKGISMKTSAQSNKLSVISSSAHSPCLSDRGEPFYRFKRDSIEAPLSFLKGQKIDKSIKDRRLSVQIQTDRGRGVPDGMIPAKQLELRLPSPTMSENHHMTPNSSATRNSRIPTGPSHPSHPHEFSGGEEQVIQEEDPCQDSKAVIPELRRVSSQEIISHAKNLIKSVRGTTAKNRAILGNTLSSGLFSPDPAATLTNQAFRPSGLKTSAMSGKTLTSPFSGVTALSPQCAKQGSLLGSADFTPFAHKMREAGVNNWCEYANKMINTSKRNELKNKSDKFYSSMLKSTIPGTRQSSNQLQSSFVQEQPNQPQRVFLSPQPIIRETRHEQSLSQSVKTSKYSRASASMQNSYKEAKQKQRAQTKLTLQQLKIMQAVGAIRAFYQVQHPLKTEDLRAKLKKRAPIISGTLQKCVDIFRSNDFSTLQKEKAELEKAYSTIETLSTQQTLLRAAFSEQKPQASNPFTKTISLSQREEAVLLRDWLEFMKKMHLENLSLSQKLELTLMSVSYAMLELRQQLSSGCTERGTVMLKVLKMVLTIPSLYAGIYEKRLAEVGDIINAKRKEIKKERKHEIEEFVEIKESKDKEIESLLDRIRTLEFDKQELQGQIKTLKLRIHNASGLLQLAQNKRIDDLRELNSKQTEILMEVYHNSKLDRIFVGQNEKEVTQDYEKNQFQEAIKDYMQIEEQPQGNLDREQKLNELVEPARDKIELETQISFEQLQDLLQFAKRFPNGIRENLLKFEEYLLKKDQLGIDAATNTGPESEDIERRSRVGGHHPPSSKKGYSQGDGSRVPTAEMAIYRVEDPDHISDKEQGAAHGEERPMTPEVDEEEQEKELVRFLSKLKEGGDQQFVTELPVKLRTVMKRFYQSMMSLPKDQYGDLVFDPTSSTKVIGMFRRRGTTLKKILNFLELDQPYTEESKDCTEDKQVQTQVMNLVQDQDYAKFISDLIAERLGETGFPERRGSKKRRGSRSPKDLNKLPSSSNERNRSKQGSANRKPNTQIKAFRFKNKHLNNAKAHPYQKLLFSLQRRIETGSLKSKFVSEVSVRFLLKQMFGIYNERLIAGKESIMVRNQRLGQFFYDFTLQKYGLVKVTQKKITEVIHSTSLHRQKIPDVELVARFLGVSTIYYSADDLNFYLDFCDSVNQMSNLNFPTFMKKEKNMFTATECYFGVAQEYIRANFEGKVGASRIQQIKEKLALMIEVPCDQIFQNEKEEYEFYYYYSLPMAIVVMVILDNYKSIKRLIYEKIKRFAAPYVSEKGELSSSEEEKGGSEVATPREAEEGMIKLGEVMSIMQSVVFFDENTYADVKQFFERNSIIYIQDAPDEPHMSTESAGEDHNRVSLDFLCGFIFRKKLMEIK